MMRKNDRGQRTEDRKALSSLSSVLCPLSSVPLPTSSVLCRTSRSGVVAMEFAIVASLLFTLLLGMIEFGLSRRLTDIVTVTDARMERILRRAGWPLRRLGNPCNLGNTLAVAGYLEISTEILAGIRSAGGFTGPVLWEPVVLAVA